MTGIGTGFAALGIGKKIGIAVGALIALALIVLLIIRAVDAHDRRMVQQGRDQVDAEWAKANDQLKQQAAQSATRADDKAAAKIEESRAEAAEDRKAVEDAQANGDSPLSALFGG